MANQENKWLVCIKYECPVQNRCNHIKQRQLPVLLSSHTTTTTTTTTCVYRASSRSDWTQDPDRSFPFWPCPPPLLKFLFPMLLFCTKMNTAEEKYHWPKKSQIYFKAKRGRQLKQYSRKGTYLNHEHEPYTNVLWPFLKEEFVQWKCYLISSFRRSNIPVLSSRSVRKSYRYGW